MEPYVRNLLEVMLSAGLSPTLVEALEQITVRYAGSFIYLLIFLKFLFRDITISYAIGCHFSIPSLLPTIQDRLLNCISSVLSRSQYSQTRPAVPMARGGMANAPQQVSDLSGSALVQLALQTLARFNFKVC